MGIGIRLGSESRTRSSLDLTTILIKRRVEGRLDNKSGLIIYDHHATKANPASNGDTSKPGIKEESLVVATPDKPSKKRKHEEVNKSLDSGGDLSELKVVKTVKHEKDRTC